MIDMDYETETYKPLPVTFGMEIEQRESTIKALRPKICNKWYNGAEQEKNDEVTWIYNPESPFNWHQDGSGPYETGTGAKSSIVGIKQFVSFIKSQSATWDWVNEYTPDQFELKSTSYESLGRNGCGSHLHFRLQQSQFPPDKLDNAWACAWNTILETSLIMMPAFIHGSQERNSYCFRYTAFKWAQIALNKRVVTLEKFATSDKPWVANVVQDVAKAHGFDWRESSYFHTTNMIDVGGHRGWMSSSFEIKHKPYTIEIRSNETHPAITAVTAGYIARVVLACIERNMSSPQFLDRDRSQQIFTDIYKECAIDGKNIVNVMKASDEIIFKVPIPKMQERYKNAWLCFADLLTKYSSASALPRHVERLWKSETAPYLVNPELWDIMDDERYAKFSWEKEYQPKKTEEPFTAQASKTTSSSEPQRCPIGHFNTGLTLNPKTRHCYTCDKDYDI